MGFADMVPGAMEALTEDTRQHKTALEAVLNAPASEERVPKVPASGEGQLEGIAQAVGGICLLPRLGGEH